MKTKNGEFIEKFNEAFLNGNMEFVKEHVTEDVKWTLVGNSPILGITDFIKEMETMNSAEKKEVKITNIITHGISAAVDGTISVTDPSGEVNTFAFCDIYKLNKFKDGKIKEITSYIIEKKK